MPEQSFFKSRIKRIDVEQIPYNQDAEMNVFNSSDSRNSNLTTDCFSNDERRSEVSCLKTSH